MRSTSFLGTKVRALYQRKKGRDLFDLWHALDRGVAQPEVIVRCFHRYMREGGHAVTRARLEANLRDKADSRAFRGDIAPLLRPGVAWDFDDALEVVMERIVGALPGDP